MVWSKIGMSCGANVFVDYAVVVRCCGFCYCNCSKVNCWFLAVKNINQLWFAWTMKEFCVMLLCFQEHFEVQFVAISIPIRGISKYSYLSEFI